MIDFEHVSKQYKKGTKPALEDINFHVDDGEFVFLLGHSGAGKSTLLMQNNNFRNRMYNFELLALYNNSWGNFDFNATLGGN